jgi:hypothetical protein
MEERVAVMMLGGEHTVDHAGAFRTPRNVVRIELQRIKRLRRRMILIDADALSARQRQATTDERPRQLQDVSEEHETA